MQRNFKMLSAGLAALLLSSLSVHAAPIQSKDRVQSVEDMPIHNYYDYSDTPDSESLQYMRESVNTALEPHNERMEQAPKDIVDAFRYTLKAVVAMQNNNTEIAQDSLDAATKLFNTVLLDEPKLDLVPIADDIDTTALDASPQQIGEVLHEVQMKLSTYKTQEARAMLMPLVDQVTVTTDYLPMKLYPKATKQAQQELKAGYSDKALETLQAAFSTIVTEEEVLPLPLIKAQAYTQNAAKFEKHDTKKALRLLEMAKGELKKAILLGYSGKNDSDYKSMQIKIERIQNSLKSGNKEVHAMFGKIEKEFSTLLGKKENSLHQKTL